MATQLTQLAIGLLGAAAIWLLEDPRQSRQRWASVVGLAAQPFWYVTLWGTDQIGILFLTVLYTGVWVRSFWRHWIAPRRMRVAAT